jgi:hypothetical protein
MVAPAAESDARSSSDEPRHGLRFGQLVRTGAALAAAGAGILHLDAARDHTEHPHIAAFFIAVGVAQLAWAASMARRESVKGTVGVGLALNGAVFLIWAVSRTAGLPDLIPDAGGVEEIGLRDVAASALELAAMAAGAFALVMPAAAAMASLPTRAGERMVRAMGAAVLAVTIPGVLATHAHDHDHESAAHVHDTQLAADGHTHTDAELAAGTHEHASSSSADDGHDHTTDGTHEHSSTDSPSSDEEHTHVHGSTTAEASGLHVHAEVVDGQGAESHAHDHTASAAGSTSTGPELPGPLDGPGNVTTLKLGPIPLLPTIPLLNLPHLSPAVPFAGPGRLNLLPLVGLPAPCTDCYVLGVEPDLVYADGSSANLDTGPMLHHAVFTDTSLDDPVCGSDTLLGQLGRRMFAVGNERTGARLPDGFGMPLTSGPWGGVAELMNTSTQLRTVYIEATVRWLPIDTPGIAPVTPAWMDIDSCGDSEFDVPAGVSDTTWDWPSTLTGRIVTAGGHLHDGGAWLGLTNTTSGEHVCTSFAGYGTQPAYLGSVESMSTCAWDRLATVRAGDVLRLDAHYNTAAPAPAVMGIMMIFVYETDDLAAGTASPYPVDPPPDGGPTGAGHHH